MASGWLASSPEDVHRHYWIDGFQPEAIINTKTGIVVTGCVWMMGRHGGQWQFSAEVPQKLVHRRTRPFLIENVCVDDEKKVLELSIAVTGDSGTD